MFWPARQSIKHVFWVITRNNFNAEKVAYWQNIAIIEPAHEIMVLFVLRKLVLQTRMCSNPVGLDV